MRSFAIRINEPCHENWDAMTPNEKGKFCGACAKTVVDFTNYSTDEIIGYFKKDKGNTCGRFTHTQLQQTYIPKNVYRGYFIKPLAAIMLPLVLLTSCNNEGVGKGAINKTSVVSTHKNVISPRPNFNVEADTLQQLPMPMAVKVIEPTPIICTFPIQETMLTGVIAVEEFPTIVNDSATIETYITIIDEQQQPIANALVENTTTKQQLFTDDLGRIAYKKFEYTNATIRISHKDFIVKNVTLNSNDDDMVVVMKKEKPVVITSNVTHVKGKIAIAPTRNYNTNTVTNLLANDTIKHNKQEKLSIYPNPITTAQLLQINTLHLPTGNYMLEVLDNAGTVLDKQFYMVNQQVLQYRFNNNHASGMYYIVLTHKNTKQRFTQQLVITN